MVPSPPPDFLSRQSGETVDVVNNNDNDAHGDEEWPWPQYLWNLPLGQRIKEIRIAGAYLKGKDKIERIRQLDALGFVWDVRKHRRHLKQLKLQNNNNNEPILKLSFQEAST